jgi:hypothetical protein
LKVSSKLQIQKCLKTFQLRFIYSHDIYIIFKDEEEFYSWEVLFPQTLAFTMELPPLPKNLARENP